jgi:hypothetical protein
MKMAKGQKRSNKETRKVKNTQGKATKAAGPKYLRQSEVLQVGNLGTKRPGKK